jgi:heme exporter protein A
LKPARAERGAGGQTAEARPAFEQRSAPPALELEGIAHRFGGTWVLRGCSLSLQAGETVALLGSNGAGKTTLLKIASTLLRPTRGAGRVFGADLLREPDAVRGSIGVLGHAPALYDDLSARENLEFACRMRGERPHAETIDRVLEEVSLRAHGGARVRGFSSGMRRRLGLARILLRPPRLLLLDEPYASLDEDGIEMTNDLVRRIASGGGAVLAATHDLPRAAEVTTRALRIVGGLLYPVGEVEWLAATGRPMPEPARLENAEVRA